MAATHPVGLSAAVAAPERVLQVLAALLFGAVLTLWVPNRWPLGIFQAGIYALTIVVVIRALWRRTRLSGRPILIALVAVVAMGVFQMQARSTSYMAATRESVLGWTANACLVFVAIQAIRPGKSQVHFLRTLFYFGFSISLLALAQMWTAAGAVFWLFPSGYSDFVMGPFVSRNLYAAFIELLLPIGLAEAAGGVRPRLHAILCGIMVASVAAGASRAGLLLTVAEVIAVLLLSRGRGPAKTQLALACVISIGLLGGAAAWNRWRDRDPYAGRREMLLASRDMVRERPWAGFGMGTWSAHYPRFAYYDDGAVVAHAHNDWAEWAVEGGLPLLALMAVMAGLTLRRGFRSTPAIGIAALWAHCAVDSPLHNPILAAWFFVVAGALAAAEGPDAARE